MENRKAKVLLGINYDIVGTFTTYRENCTKIDVDQLIHFFEEGETDLIRMNALSFLGHHKDNKKATDYLVKLFEKEIKEPNVLMLKNIISGMIDRDLTCYPNMGDEFIKLYKNGDRKIQTTAMLALRGIDGDNVLDVLLPVALSTDKDDILNHWPTLAIKALYGKNDERVINAFCELYERHKDGRTNSYSYAILSEIAKALKGVTFPKANIAEMKAHSLLRSMIDLDAKNIRSVAVQSLPEDVELLWGLYNNTMREDVIYSLIKKFGTLEYSESKDILKKIMNVSRDNENMEARYYHAASALLKYQELPINEAIKVMEDLYGDPKYFLNLCGWNLGMQYSCWIDLQEIILDRLTDWQDHVSAKLLKHIFIPFFYGLPDNIIALKSFVCNYVSPKLLVEVVNDILYTGDLIVSLRHDRLKLLLEEVINGRYFESIFSSIRLDTHLDFWAECLLLAKEYTKEKNRILNYEEYLKKIIFDKEKELDSHVRIRIIDSLCKWNNKIYSNIFSALIKLLKSKTEDFEVRVSAFFALCKGNSYPDVKYLFSFFEEGVKDNLELTKKRWVLTCLCSVGDTKLDDMILDYFNKNPEMIYHFSGESKCLSKLSPV
jgi:HEAT repeat protein